jgi:hypothetical protein
MQANHKRSCLNLLDGLDRHTALSIYFKGEPETSLESESLKEQYRKEIATPKDLLTIRHDLENDQYNSIMDFIEDVNLCFENAKKFCKQRYKIVFDAAAKLQKMFQSDTHKVMMELSKTPTPAPAPTAKTSSTATTAAVTESKKRKSTSASTAVTTSPPVVVSWTKGFENKCRALIDSMSSWGYKTTFDILSNRIDLSCFPDYKLRIPTPMAFIMIKDKLKSNAYSHPDEVATDIRIVFSNFFIYNFSKDSLTLRTEARNLLLKFEKEW